MPELTRWSNFYVIIGSSAGALIGLQFVVLTLIAQRPPARAREASAAFASPSVVHFSVVLLLAALSCAPWYTIGAVATVWGLVGVAATVYGVIVALRMRKQKAYRPVFEDWLFHSLLPLVAYAMLMISAFIIADVRRALFCVAAATLLLLFVGIHNAWDGITYLVFVHLHDDDKAE